MTGGVTDTAAAEAMGAEMGEMMKAPHQVHRLGPDKLSAFIWQFIVRTKKFDQATLVFPIAVVVQHEIDCVVQQLHTRCSIGFELGQHRKVNVEEQARRRPGGIQCGATQPLHTTVIPGATVNLKREVLSYTAFERNHWRECCTRLGVGFVSNEGHLAISRRRVEQRPFFGRGPFERRSPFL